MVTDAEPYTFARKMRSKNFAVYFFVALKLFQLGNKGTATDLSGEALSPIEIHRAVLADMVDFSHLFGGGVCDSH